MPVRPEMAGRYPADWDEITARIRQRAGNACECAGECGSDHGEARRCGAPNGAIVVRNVEHPEKWSRHIGCSLCLGGDDECRPIKIVLTVAHFPDKAPENCAPTNLLACCQRCHLRLDAVERRTNAAETRLKRAEAASGQTRLF